MIRGGDILIGGDSDLGSITTIITTINLLRSSKIDFRKREISLVNLQGLVDRLVLVSYIFFPYRSFHGTKSHHTQRI
jgi:hypothetical protein